ncbi:MAG: hypothetical protein QW273_02090 [Candidatus Pacearchaeota archaeon]
MNRKGDLQFSWIFAILVGSAILFFIIYAAFKFGGVITFFSDTSLAKEITVFLEPMQAGITEGKKSSFISKREVLFENYCVDEGLGYQMISVAMVRRIEENPSFGEQIKVTNKYVYTTKNPSKEFFIFSVPITFAFKISDVIIIGEGEYCVVNPNEETKTLLEIIGKNIKFGEENCTEDSIRICFDSFIGCDIIIRGKCFEENCESLYEIGNVEKNGESILYAGNLLYPALFSDKEIYECNLKRIFYKGYLLSKVYLEKMKKEEISDFDMKDDLEYLKNRFLERDISSLHQIYLLSKEIRDKEKSMFNRIWS